MSRKDGMGRCKHCGRSFEYFLIHNGFNGSAYSYYDTCGTTALLEGWRIPSGLKVRLHGALTVENEASLALAEGWKSTYCVVIENRVVHDNSRQIIV